MVINKRPDIEDVPATAGDPPEGSAADLAAHPWKALDGARFIARRRLSDSDDETLADVGETCERVPVTSLRALLEAGHIAPKEGT